MSAKAKVGIIGKIISGKEKGFYVKVLDDAENTGGYIILTFERLDRVGKNYDTWLEKQEELQEYFDEVNWTIEWLE